MTAKADMIGASMVSGDARETLLRGIVLCSVAVDVSSTRP